MPPSWFDNLSTRGAYVSCPSPEPLLRLCCDRGEKSLCSCEWQTAINCQLCAAGLIQSPNRYLTMHHKACTPSFHVIFFPSSYVRPA